MGFDFIDYGNGSGTCSLAEDVGSKRMGRGKFEQRDWEELSYAVLHHRPFWTLNMCALTPIQPIAPKTVRGYRLMSTPQAHQSYKEKNSGAVSTYVTISTIRPIFSSRSPIGLILGLRTYQGSGHGFRISEASEREKKAE